MEKVILRAIKEVSNKEISVKKNYKLFRIIEKITNTPILKKNKYKDVIFNLGDRNIKTRFFNTSLIKNGLIIFIHGGGWISGSVESYTNICLELAEKTKRSVVSIDYRLAPEYPYPNGLNDCYEVIKLIMDNLNKMNLKNEDVCLMGDSAGGNLVAAISIKSRKEKDFKIKKQILIYPSLQCNYSKKTRYKSVIEKGKDYLLTQKQLQEYISLYIPNTKDLCSPFVSPMNVKFPFFQPDTLIITAEHDPLRDEGKGYARKLKLYCNYVEYYNVEGAIHGFLSNSLDKKHKEITYKKIIEFLGDNNEDKK